MQWLMQNERILQNLISSGILITAVTILRILTIRYIRKTATKNIDLKKRWIQHTRSLAFVVLIIGLVVVWASELQAFAISLVAVAAAVVLATKELILCALGGLLRAFNKPFRVGDRIEVGGIRGDVVEFNIFITIINEIGPGKLAHQYTGRRVILPNSQFLNNSIYNDTITKKYSIHSFVVPFPREGNILNCKHRMLTAAEKVCSSYLIDAKKYLDKITSMEGNDYPSVNPRVILSFPSQDRADLIIRVPVPSRRAGKIEQAILEEYFAQGE